jgi:hypothetical protein
MGLIPQLQIKQLAATSEAFWERHVLICPASVGLTGNDVDAAAGREHAAESAAVRTVGREANRTAGV